MSRDEIRIRLTGPDRYKNAAVVMAEFQRRIWEEEQERAKRGLRPDDDPAEVIEHEP